MASSSSQGHSSGSLSLDVGSSDSRESSTLHIDLRVKEYFYKYRRSSTITTFAESIQLLKNNIDDDIIVIDRVSVVDNMCHGWEGYH